MTNSAFDFTGFFNERVEVWAEPRYIQGELSPLNDGAKDVATSILNQYFC